MLKFCANLHFMYLEFPFLDRFAAAAADGFRAVEMTYPYEFPAGQIRRHCDAAGIGVVSFNAPVGEIIPGRRRGIAVLPGMGSFADTSGKGSITPGRWTAGTC